MSVKRNFLVGIIDDTKINQVNKIISKYSTMTFEYSSFMFFSKQPIDSENIPSDIMLFRLEGDNEGILDKQLNELIDELNGLDADYVLGDDDSKELIVTIDFVAKLFIRFDNVEVVRQGTFEKIDELKSLKTDFGYCRGFKPSFRPFEGSSIEDKEVHSEIIYLISDSRENLCRLNDFISERVMEIDSNLKIEFKVFEL